MEMTPQEIRKPEAEVQQTNELCVEKITVYRECFSMYRVC